MHQASGACPISKPQKTGPSIAVDQLDDHSIYGGNKIYTESNITGSQLASLFRLTTDTQISLMEWSGMINGAGTTEKFLVRIFSGDDLPERLAYEFEVTANVKSITNFNKSPSRPVHVFSFKPTGLALPAGNYWISILSRRFFWGQELSASTPVTCGSGGARRLTDTSNWITASSDSPTTQPAVSAPGFSFRLTANSGSR